MSGIKTIIQLAIVDERGRKHKNRTFFARFINMYFLPLNLNN